MGNWKHCEILEYEQIPLKCSIYHEHNHLDRDCKKALSKAPEKPQSVQGDQSCQWQTH
jgi:hypothetical protein